jgi:hypothetical protein
VPDCARRHVRETSCGSEVNEFAQHIPYLSLGFELLHRATTCDNFESNCLLSHAILPYLGISKQVTPARFTATTYLSRATADHER